MKIGKFYTEDRDYYAKWTALGVVIGVIAGLASTLFYFATEAAENFFMQVMLGYYRPLPFGEGGTLQYVFSLGRFYLIPASIIIGALLSAFVVYRFAPETEGHGTDAVINAYHKKHGTMRVRASIVKFVSSSLLIGSGGSAGREGPIAQISASLASAISKSLKINKRDRQILAAVAVGSAIGSIFKSPFGGALFGAEVLYRRDIEGDVIYPSFLASAVGFIVFGAFINYLPMFGINALSSYAQTAIFQPVVLLGFIVLGLISGAFARIYVRIFYYINRKIRSLRVSRYFKPAIGAIGTAAIALAFPEIMGVGYGWVQFLIEGKLSMLPNLLGLPILEFALAIVFAKILASSLSIGSGGSGGVFAPGMFIGADVGIFTFLLLQIIVPNSFTVSLVTPFVIVGMLSVFGGASKAPIAVAIMVLEMTGSILVVPTAMLSIAVAYLVSGNDTIYASQRVKRK